MDLAQSTVVEILIAAIMAIADVHQLCNLKRHVQSILAAGMHYVLAATLGEKL